LRCRAIVANGTSADAQLAVYRQARDKGAERGEALAAVNEWLAQATLGRDDPGRHPAPAAITARMHPTGPALRLPPSAEMPIRLDRDLAPDMPAI